MVPTPTSRPTYWLYHELLAPAAPPRPDRGERLRTVLRGTDAILDCDDPLPFLVVHHVQIPSLLLRNLRQRWRVDQGRLQHRQARRGGGGLTCASCTSWGPRSSEPLGRPVTALRRRLPRRHRRPAPLRRTWRLRRARRRLALPERPGAAAMPWRRAAGARGRGGRTSSAALGVDVVVPQMFCLPGMTTYRALFDLLGHPLRRQHPRRDGARRRDKARAKAVVAAAGVAVPARRGGARGERGRRSGLPAVVKPVDADNSLGVTLVRDASAYDARAGARRCGARRPSALVEDYVELGREVRCGVLERRRRAGLPAAGGVRRRRRDQAGPRPRRQARARRRRTASPWWPRTPRTRGSSTGEDPVTDAVWAAARTLPTARWAAATTASSTSASTPTGRPWFLEAGLYCSFAEQSVVAVMAGAAGHRPARAVRARASTRPCPDRVRGGSR